MTGISGVNWSSKSPEDESITRLYEGRTYAESDESRTDFPASKPIDEWTFTERLFSPSGGEDAKRGDDRISLDESELRDRYFDEGKQSLEQLNIRSND